MNFDDLIAKSLVKEKHYPNTGLAIYKYAKKVFWDNLWYLDARLLEARGMVVDKTTGEVVIHPFSKVFNYGENGAGRELTDSTRVRAIQKLNGFMAAARLHHDELIISSTGSLNSDFVIMAREHIEKLKTDMMSSNYTYIFEICDKRDPHIVAEEEGAYLIGMRHMPTGQMVIDEFLDYFSHEIEAKRASWKDMTFGELRVIVKDCKHEGFMVQDLQDYSTICKWKSPHYLSKKFLMRLGDGKALEMFDNPSKYKERVDEEFYQFIDWLTSSFNRELWIALGDQNRREVIERYFETKGAFS